MQRATSRTWLVSCFFLFTLLAASTSVARDSRPQGQIEDDTGPVGELPVGSSGGQQIPVGGGNIKLDHLGPTIVAEDGELRRIQNWDKLTKAEQETAWRRIQKRNTDRLEELRQKGQEGDRHDSTLGGFEEQGTAQDRAAKASEHLKHFLAGLDGLKQKGAQVPGLDGLEDLLKGPSKQGSKQDVDPAALRQKLQELQKNTEKLRKQGFLRDEL
eukprot:jgi/Ulvmu1/11008/UM007_0188.1